MGTFSILFRMVLRSTPPIFSFLLIFSKLDQKMSQFYWTIMWKRALTALTCFEINCLTTLKLYVSLLLTVHFFEVILKYGIEYRPTVKSYNYSWSNETILVKYVTTVEICKDLRCKSWNFGIVCSSRDSAWRNKYQRYYGPEREYAQQ